MSQTFLQTFIGMKNTVKTCFSKLVPIANSKSSILFTEGSMTNCLSHLTRILSLLHYYAVLERMQMSRIVPTQFLGV